jgi:hypothetical protein
MATDRHRMVNRGTATALMRRPSARGVGCVESAQARFGSKRRHPRYHSKCRAQGWRKIPKSALR